MLSYDLIAHLRRQREFSTRTFGPGVRTQGIVRHIRRELEEIEGVREPAFANEEFIDVILLALDGAWRLTEDLASQGDSAHWKVQGIEEYVIELLRCKQAANELRRWPDWRTLPQDAPIEHVRD